MSSRTIRTKSGIFRFLPLTSLVSLPFESRPSVLDADLEDLAKSIREVGVVEPIVVREKGGFYEVVLGERRRKASQMAGQTEIPAIIKVLSDEQAYDLQLIENVQRKDLSDMEKARALKWRIDTFGYKQKDLAKKLGKSETWVSLHLAMLKDEGQLYPGKVGEYTEKHARELRAVSPEKRSEIFDEISRTGKLPSTREIHTIGHSPDLKDLAVLSKEIEKEFLKEKVKCAECYEPFLSSRAKLIHGSLYCPKCAPEMSVKTKNEKASFSVVEPWEDRDVRTHPGKSKLELSVIRDLQAEGYPINMAKVLHVLTTKPSAYVTQLKAVVYFESEDSTETLTEEERMAREMLEKDPNYHVKKVVFGADTPQKRERVKNMIRSFLMELQEQK